MKSFLSSITFDNPWVLAGMVLLVALRFAVMIWLRKSFLEEKTIRIINWIASILVGLLALGTLFLMADNASVFR